MNNILLHTAFASCCLLAAPDALPADELPSEWHAVETDLLEDMRGGFLTDLGLKISFGIERTVNVNGELASAIRFATDDIGKLVKGKTKPVLPDNFAELIQNGPGNVFEGKTVSSAAAATFIQNSLNDQIIQSQTVINAATNSLEILKGMNLQSILNDALLNAATLR